MLGTIIDGDGRWEKGKFMDRYERKEWKGKKKNGTLNVVTVR